MIGPMRYKVTKCDLKFDDLGFYGLDMTFIVYDDEVKRHTTHRVIERNVGMHFGKKPKDITDAIVKDLTNMVFHESVIDDASARLDLRRKKLGFEPIYTEAEEEVI